MLRHIHMETTLFGSGDNKAEAETDLMWILEALTQRNQTYLKNHPSTPRLYRSGVVWEAPKQFDGDCYETSVLRKALGDNVRQRDVRKVLDLVQDVFGGEHFCDIGVILELGAIDCDGLAAYRTAELRQAGIKARPYMTSRKRFGGGTTYHALVLWPPLGPANYETSEDPSLLLGMGGPSRAADRDEEIRKNKERCDIIAGRIPSPPQPLNFDASLLEEVLGLRRPQRPELDPSLAEIDSILRRTT